MNATVTVRRGTTGDHAFVRELGRRVSMTSVSSQRPTTPEFVEEAFERLLDFIATRDHLIVIAESGLVRVGFGLLVFDIPDEVSLEPQGFVAYTAVEPEHRRRGYARAMLAAMEELTRERGLRHLGLMVTEDNEAARALYESAGFSTERRQLVKPL